MRTNNKFEELYNDMDFLVWAAEVEHDPGALFLLGCKYYYGDGVAQDTKIAVKYIRQSAELGEPQSAELLAIAYRDGEGVDQSYTSAVHWFLIAANKGLPESMFALSRSYLFGRGVKADTEQSVL